MSRRWWNNKPNTFAIPLAIVIAVIILLLVFKGISKLLSGDAGAATKEAGQSYALVTPGPESKIGIIMASSDSPTEIKEPSKLFATDKMLRVISGNGEVTLENSQTKLAIESLTELAYLGKKQEKESFQLFNGYSWIDSKEGDSTVTLKHFIVKSGAPSIFIINQNTLASNVYVLVGEVEVQGEKSTAIIRSGQMLSVLKSQASSNNFGEMISPLDDNIKLSNIYSKNNGDAVLARASEKPTDTMSGSEVTGSGSTLTGSTSATSQVGISVTYPEDEMTVDTDIISIEWKILGGNIKKITFDKTEAKILAEDNSFILNGFPLAEQSNDIVYRAFDENGNQVQKETLTVYVSNKKKPVKKPDVISYPVSSKDFKIISPGINPYKTTERAVKIKGSFAPNLVKFIKVNSYQLQQFKQYGTDWVYNASIDNGNMEEGMNEYLVTYFWPNDEVLATTKVYIVKELEVVTPAPQKIPEQAPNTNSGGTTGSSSTNTGSTGTNL